MALIGWVDPATDLDEWADAPLDEDILARYLTAGHEQCEAYLPHIIDADTGLGTPVVPDPVPARLVLAQIMQARALYRAALAGSGDQIGPDGLTVTVWPMDRTVKALLRPRRGTRVPL